jgi:hypothetical protein
MFESRRPSSMEPGPKNPKSPHPRDLPSMLATLCSYENQFGPRHPATLILMTQLGLAYWLSGQTDRARVLLESAVRDLGRYIGPDCDTRLQAMKALRDLYSAECDFDRAEAIQRELSWSHRGMEEDEEANCEYSPLGKFIFHS